MMDAQVEEKFRQQTHFFHQPRRQKLARAPVLMASSALKLAWCRALGKVLPTRVRTFWGQPMEVLLPEPGSVALMHYGFLEEGLTSLLLRLVRPGMIFFDVGAHYGYFTLMASRLVESGGEVHSFEPCPHTFEVLKRNVAATANIRLNNLALYSHCGELTFHDYGVEFSEFNTLTAGRIPQEMRRGRSLQSREIKVRADTLDNYVRQSGVVPDFIKLDAEGAELQILGGMSETMRHHKPMITLEVAPDPADAQGATARCMSIFEENGYVPHEWSAGEIRPHQIKATYVYDNLLFMHPRGKSSDEL